jgi:hypothetical protein
MKTAKLDGSAKTRTHASPDAAKTEGKKKKKLRADLESSHSASKVLGKSDGTAASERARAKSAGLELVTESSPLFARTAKTSDEITVLISAQDWMPAEARDAIEALVKKHGDDLRELPSSEMGSSLFSSQTIYKLKSSLLPKLEKALDGVENVSITPLAPLFAVKGSNEPFSPALVDALAGSDLTAKIRALIDLDRLLDKQDGVPADPETREKIGDAVYSIVHTVVSLFNATLLEETRARRMELLAATPDKKEHAAGCGCPVCAAISSKITAYFRASSRAVDELRDQGGTSELTVLRGHVLRAAEVLDRLETPRARTLLTQLMPHGDGVIFEHLVQNPDQALRLLDHLTGEAKSRLDQTVASIDVPYADRPKDLRGSASSGGLNRLPGHVNTQTIHLWSKDYPFDDIAATPLAFLGTDLAPEVRGKLKSFFLAADGLLPSLLEKHKKAFIAEEIAKWEPMVKSLTERAPPEKKAETEARVRGEAAEQAEESYDWIRALTGQRDVDRLIESFAWLSMPSKQAGSVPRALIESLRLFGELVTEVKTPQLHRRLADVGLLMLEQIEAHEPPFPKEVGEAARAFEKQLTKGGADPEIRLLAGSFLAKEGRLDLVPLAIEALSAANEELRSLGARALETVARAQSKPSSKLAKQLKGALPALTERLSDPDSVWIQMTAGLAVARIDPSHAKTLEVMRSLFAADGGYVKFSADRGGTKNAAVRQEAAKVLGALGTHASSALPNLEAAIAIGEKADQARDLISKSREKKEKSGKEYFFQKDPEAIALAKAVLEQPGLEKDHASKAALHFLADPKSPDLSKIPSYQWHNYPSAEQALFDLSEVGRAAKEARDRITAAPS